MLANHLAQGEFKSTIELSTKLIAEIPEFARAYGFRGLANFEIVITDLAQIINNVTVKSLNLKASEKSADRSHLVKEIVADWESVYGRMRSFTSDLHKALDLDEEIFLDFDIKSTETFKRHWNEGVGEFLKGTLEIVNKYDASAIEMCKKNLKNLTSKLLDLFQMLENPPKHLNVPEDYLKQNSGNASDKDVQEVDFGETIIDFDIASIARSGILAKSQHIVAYTMNSAIQSKESQKKVIQKKKPLIAKTKDEKNPVKSDADVVKAPIKSAKTTTKPHITQKTPSKSGKAQAKITNTPKILMRSAETMTDIDIKPSRPAKPKTFTDSGEDGFLSNDFSTSKKISTRTLNDTSLRKELNYKDVEVLGKSHSLVRNVRFYLDNYCKNTEGHTYPTLNDFIKPAELTRRFMYIFEFHFLFQKRKLSWHKKIYEGEEPRGIRFNAKTVNKWDYSHDRFSYRSGSFNKPVVESFTLVDCDNCDGEGRFSCTQCNGIGRIKCDLCEGMGAYPPEADKFTSPCPECDGTGGVTCPACHNEGFVNCETCNGRGQVLRFLNLGIEQENQIESQFYPAEFYPRDAELHDLKKRYSNIVLAEEFKGLPDISDMQKILPDELTIPILKLYEKMKPDKEGNANKKLFATAIKVYEIEILRFEYFAKIKEEGSTDKRFSADFVMKDYKIYPDDDPHLNLVQDLQNRLKTSLSKSRVRESKRIIKNLSTIIGKHDVLQYAKTRIIKKARLDYRIAVLPASIISLILLFFMPDFTEVSSALKSWHVFVVPVFILTFCISLVLRSVLKTLIGGFLSRLIFLTIMSVIICGGAVYWLSQVDSTLFQRFVSFVESHIFSLL